MTGLEEGFFTIPTEPGDRPRLIGSYSQQPTSTATPAGVEGQHEWEIDTRMVLELHPVALNSEGDGLCPFRFAPIGTGG